MLSLLLALPLLLAPAPEDPPKPEPPAEEVVDAATEALTAALAKDADKQAVLDALQAHGAVADAKVAKLVAKLADADDLEVRTLAIARLGALRHAQAVKELVKFHKDKQLRKSDELTSGVLQALSMHGDPDTIDRFTDGAFDHTQRLTCRARVLGLARIRDEESVKALYSLATKAAPRHVGTFLPDFRCAMMALTGQDPGGTQKEWHDWWGANKRDLKLLPEPVLTKRYQRRLDAYWGTEERREKDEGEKKKGGGEGDGERRRRKRGDDAGRGA